MKRRTLIDLIERDLDRDPRDAPALVLQDAIDLQDLRWMPETSEPGHRMNVYQTQPPQQATNTTRLGSRMMS